MTRRPLHIGLSLSATWLRGNAWRRDDSRVHEAYTLPEAVDVARLAERAALDFLLKPDALHLDPDSVAAAPAFTGLDPLVLLSALVGATSRIGLIPTFSTTFTQPFLVARAVHTLDRLSRGRAGWNAVMSLDGHRNLGWDEMPDSAHRYARAAEFVAVVDRLQGSFPQDALLLDRASGRFADPTRIRPIDHVGEHFHVAGPSTVPARAGRPPLLQAGASPAGRDFAASCADAVFAAAPDLDSAREQRDDLRRRAAAHGRAPDAVRVLPGVALYLAPTRAQARRLFEDARTAQDEQREAARGPLHWTVIGTPEDAADAIAAWHDADAIDGVIALPAGSRTSLDLFCTRTVPALAAAGRFRRGYAGATLREHMGMDPGGPGGADWD